MSDLIVAADGGGRKTDLALVRADGSLVSLVRGGSSHAHHLGIEGSVQVLEGVLEDAIARDGLGRLERPFAAVGCFLLAGADLPEELPLLRARIERLRWSERLVVDNDTVALLRAGTDRGWGVAVVCGTGINGIGIASDGREVRFPSLGQISGDWGGGGDIGRAALGAAARSADRRGAKTELEEAVPEHFGLAQPLDVARALHFAELAPERLAELAPVVLATAEHDAVAAGIVERLAEEVVAFARAAIVRLNLGGSDPDVVLGGGVLRAVSQNVIETIARGVRQFAPDARVIVSASEPIVGAVLLGLDAVRADRHAAARARAELDAAAAVR